MCGLLASCVVTEYDQYNQTLDGEYILSELNGQALGSDEYQMEEPPVLVFNPVDLQVNGFSGCNELSGRLKELTEHDVRFGKFRMTRKACPGNLEADFLAMLEKTNRYEFRHGKLMFYQDNALLAKFFERKVKAEVEEEM